ncbi:uncharacterized exonuclease domain-containing protein At3g15140 [Euphorbia lathyris]|uniref:uncharacterized exonuclease domain-containing protein At3g15140 n=1 Tax=Euphorbia lathyris TaxID=212925 RepID=UPI0033144275
MSLLKFSPFRIPSFRSTYSSIIPLFHTPQKPAYYNVRTFDNSTPYCTQTHIDSFPSMSSSSSSSSSSTLPSCGTMDYRWRPMCLYHSQGKCTMMDDPTHLEKFNHDCSRDLPVNAADLDRKRPQDFDFLLVLDLEGKVEILEFPVLILDTRTMGVVDLFHRFVRPSAMSEQRINEYIGNKYGEFGVDRVWHDTAIPFNEVIQEFEAWLILHNLWDKKHGGHLNRAAFVTCGNWDVKTQVPHQCSVSKIKLPPYFMEWINLKAVYNNFYNPKPEVKGMRGMMRQLNMKMMGNHHLGIDDTKNIARVLQKILADGADIKITAWRNPDGSVNFRHKKTDSNSIV